MSNDGNRVLTIDTSVLNEGMAQSCHPSAAIKLRKGVLPGQTFGVQTSQSIQVFQQFITVPANISGIGWAQTAIPITITNTHNRIILAPPYTAENTSPNNPGWLCLDVNPPSTFPFLEAGNYLGSTGLGIINIRYGQQSQTPSDSAPWVDLPLAGNRTVWLWVTSTGQSYSNATYVLTRITAMNIQPPAYFE